jgi:hypothetical protein
LLFDEFCNIDPLNVLMTDIILLVNIILIISTNNQYIYATFLPHALQPGFALCTRSIIGAFKATGLALGIVGGGAEILAPKLP